MWKSETLIQVKEILLTVSTMFINAIKIKILIQILLHVAVDKCIHDKHSRKGTCVVVCSSHYTINYFTTKSLFWNEFGLMITILVIWLLFWNRLRPELKRYKPTIVDTVITARYYVSVKLISLMEEINKVTQSKSGQPAQSKHSTAAEKPW